MMRKDYPAKKKKHSKFDKYGSVSKIEGKKFNASRKRNESKKGPKNPLENLKGLPTPFDVNLR